MPAAKTQEGFHLLNKRAASTNVPRKWKASCDPGGTEGQLAIKSF